MSKDILKKILRSQSHTSKAQKVGLDTLNPQEYLIIDVRSPSVFATTPHIQGAINLYEMEELQEFCKQNQKSKILLTCNGGLEAAKYGTKLVDLGFENIYFLDEYLQIIQEYLPLENL